MFLKHSTNHGFENRLIILGIYLFILLVEDGKVIPLFK